jgi:archaellum biogenesis ATPase FlaH
MSSQAQYAYDVFVSYSHADEEWVQDELWPQLEGAGLKISDEREFELGAPKILNIERAIEASRKVLLILTPDWVASEWANFESLLIQTDDLSSRIHRTVPLLLRPCELPKRLSTLTYTDFIQSASRDDEMRRLLRALGTRARIFISYKRNGEPDQSLAKRLYTALGQAGHRVFIDQTMKVGIEWAREIDRQIEASDFFVVLLSDISVNSEMVAKEVEYAHRQNQRTGKSRLLPVRIKYPGTLPYSLSPYLDQIQQATWQSDADTEGLVVQLLDAVSHFAPLPVSAPRPSPPSIDHTHPVAPRPAADLRFVEALREPSGAARLRSPFYIEREGDERLHRELGKPYGTTTTIRAPRQTGKSSLLIRGVAQAQAQGSKVVSIDLQPVEEQYLESMDGFLHYFATLLVTKLRLDTMEVEKAWGSALGASDKTTYLMEDYVLPLIETKMILAIDEADRLLRTSFHDNFFGLLRFWHNNRAMNELWDRLDIVMVISTEPHLLIKDVTQSPFNVGLKIVLEDFDLPRVRELNLRYQSPLDEREVQLLMDFLNGHPYLTRKALYTLVTEQITWGQLTATAITQQSPFGDHLRRYLWLLRDQSQLRAALKQIIDHGRCSDEMLFYRLSQAGLVKGADSTHCAYRCQLYADYLKDKL